MLNKHYQVTIIGGGVQGCAIAQACAAAGFQTLLIEKNTFGSGTSCKSSKLIHGGLRYLQTSQFNLVRKCLKEREWMIKHLPSLVKREWFLIPVYQEGYYRAWQIHLALTAYYLLGGANKQSQFKKLSTKQIDDLKGINKQGLKHVFAYQDAQTDDLALTRYIQKNAEQLGAKCLEETAFRTISKTE